MNLRSLLLLILGLVVLLPIGRPTADATAAAPERPNIVLLIGDDHGWPYSGFMGDPFVQTPNLDALAAGGTLFTQGQDTSSVCVPSLRALLAAIHTDQWDAHRAAVEALVGPQRFRSEVAYYWTVPRALAWQGYTTWEGGKLWEGTFSTAGFTQGMATTISKDFFSSVGDQFGREGWENGHALDPFRAFLDATDGPFFAWVAPLLPHTPLDAPQEFQALYENLGLTPQESSYYANVSWFDALVGAIVEDLEARGLRKDTLLVYLSDNGIGIDQPFAGLGQGKGTLAELGFRTPVILNWPGHVPAGAVRDDLVAELDVPATILDYAGADPIAAGGGRSLKDAVESGAPVGHEKIVGHYEGNTPNNTGFWVRTPTWRYVRDGDGSEQIYAIASDPFEQLDVAALHADLLPAFRADVVDWQASLARAPDELDAAGRLTNAGGAPLAGELIELSGRSKTGVNLRLQVRTARNGDFRFVALPQGSYALRSARHVPLRLGSRTGVIPVALPFGGLDGYYPLQAAPPRAPLAAGAATIRGTLRDDLGRPLGQQTVLVRGRDADRITIAVLSAADGRYRAENLPSGGYDVNVIPGPRVRVSRGRTVQLGAGATATLDLVAAVH